MAVSGRELDCHEDASSPPADLKVNAVSVRTRTLLFFQKELLLGRGPTAQGGVHGRPPSTVTHPPFGLCVCVHHLL